MGKTLRIATRQSPLALWQAEFVKAELEKLYTDLIVELIPMVTRGDKILDTPLAKIGGKGLFVKELEHAMLQNKADIAVHSMKDVPMEFPDGLGLSVICEREDPRDAFVSNHYQHLDDLPVGAKVGTCSLRRQCQLKAQRPDFQILELRGNVGTRLSKLDSGQYDAIILASAGLKRLGLSNRIAHEIEPDRMLPAGGQGAVGIECRVDDRNTLALLAPLNHPMTAVRVKAERAVNHYLQGGCQVPIGVYSTVEGEVIDITALVGEPDGSLIIQDQIHGSLQEAEALGVELAKKLLDSGAGKILDKLGE